MNFKKFIDSDYLKDNPLCGIDTYKDELNLATGACTRQIKKLVLTGEENVIMPAISSFQILGVIRWGDINGFCTHYSQITWDDATYATKNGFAIHTSSDGADRFRICDLSITTVADFKAYLAAQYAAGTPVIVWYVLATPTTETITVPTGLSGTEEGYLNQSGTPTPTNPIYPTANTVENWFNLNHYIMGTSTDTITTLPAVLYPNAITATVALKGTTVQNGTPTPDAPIDVFGVGDNPRNVMPAGEQKTVESNGITFSSDGNGKYNISGTATAAASARFNLRSAFTTPISVSNGGQGTLSFFNTQDNNNVTFAFYNNTTKVDDWRQSPIRRTSTAYNAVGNKYINNVVITVASGATVDIEITPEFTNDSILPSEFKPWGVSIPITSANTTTNIYLGEAQTTRKIKKLVLTGNENWFINEAVSTEDTIYFYTSVVDSTFVPDYSVCSHFEYKNAYSIRNENGYHLLSGYGGIRFRVMRTIADTLANFKSYLAAQYDAGTPVTIWYVLKTEETGIVNEPLMKIDNYADTVSGITIPTITSSDTFDVQTTLKPSEVSLNYTGWHPVIDTHVIEGLLANNPLCGIGNYKDELNLATGDCTRQIKKLVLDGTENWAVGSANYYSPLPSNGRPYSNALCTHSENATSIDNSGNYLYLQKMTFVFETLADFKTYLAAQYAAGTPVTVWYVLATPITETITVPTGLSGTEEGYLIQDGTPTPTNPIYPTANEVPIWS